jgi:hypothetical protein
MIIVTERRNDTNGKEVGRGEKKRESIMAK